MNFRAARPGTLPTTSTIALGGVRCGPGTLVVPDPSIQNRVSVGPPVAWVGPTPTPRLHTLWLSAARAFPESGLWPVVLESLDGDGARPWRDGELAPSEDAPDGVDVAELLANAWSQAVEMGEEEPEELAPFGATFPGLGATPATVPSDDPLGVLAGVVVDLDGALGLVAVSRPADTLAVIGWLGAVNYDLPGHELSAVLRSWEDRFGAFIVGVGFDTVTLAVTRPPADLDEALPIAAEIFAFCPDTVYQGVGSLGELAESLVQNPSWSFWWD